MPTINHDSNANFHVSLVLPVLFLPAQREECRLAMRAAHIYRGYHVQQVIVRSKHTHITLPGQKMKMKTINIFILEINKKTVNKMNG
jgi:hypothetical protein